MQEYSVLPDDDRLRKSSCPICRQASQAITRRISLHFINKPDDHVFHVVEPGRLGIDGQMVISGVLPLQPRHGANKRFPLTVGLQYRRARLVRGKLVKFLKPFNAD